MESPLTETACTDREYVNPWYRKPENRMKWIENRKAWYHEHKDEVLARRRTKITCELCGGIYTTDHRQQHFRTMKHRSAEMNARSQVATLLRMLGTQCV